MNCGGEAHLDVTGIHYLRDMNKVGTASDYGKQLLIGRVPQKDQIIYQTERYHTSTFGYDIPISEDGRYMLILKFSEVYFNAPNMKVSIIHEIAKFSKFLELHKTAENFSNFKTSPKLLKLPKFVRMH